MSASFCSSSTTKSQFALFPQQKFGTLHIQRQYTFLCGRGCKLYAFTSALDSGERLASRLDHFTSTKISTGRTTHYIRAWLDPSSSTSAVVKGGACACCQEKNQCIFLISSFRRVLNIVCFLLGNSPASKFYTLTFRSTLSIPSSQADRYEERLGQRMLEYLYGERFDSKNSEAGELHRRKRKTNRCSSFPVHIVSALFNDAVTC